MYDRNHFCPRQSRALDSDPHACSDSCDFCTLAFTNGIARIERVSLQIDLLTLVAEHLYVLSPLVLPPCLRRAKACLRRAKALLKRRLHPLLASQSRIPIHRPWKAFSAFLQRRSASLYAHKETLDSAANDSSYHR